MDFKRKTSNSKTYLYSSWPAVSRISWKTIRPTSLKESLVPVGRNPIKIKKLKLQNNNSYLLKSTKTAVPRNSADKLFWEMSKNSKEHTFSWVLLQQLKLKNNLHILLIVSCEFLSFFTNHFSLNICQWQYRSVAAGYLFLISSTTFLKPVST